MARQNIETLGLPKEVYVSQRAQVDELFTSVKGLPYVHFVDISDLFCGEGAEYCKIVHNGYPLYRDSNHLSIQGAYYLTDRLETIFSDMKDK